MFRKEKLWGKYNKIKYKDKKKRNLEFSIIFNFVLDFFLKKFFDNVKHKRIQRNFFSPKKSVKKIVKIFKKQKKKKIENVNILYINISKWKEILNKIS